MEDREKQVIDQLATVIPNLTEVLEKLYLLSQSNPKLFQMALGFIIKN
jgi:hypothetical protein